MTDPGINSVVVTRHGSLVTVSDPEGRWLSATLPVGDHLALILGPLVIFAEVAKARSNTEMRRRRSGSVHLIKSHSLRPDGQHVKTYCNPSKNGWGDHVDRYTDQFPNGAKRCAACVKESTHDY